MTKPARAWSLITLDDHSRHYGGNTGYRDDVERMYRYDAAVPNHKQLSEGDLVFIRDAKSLIGVARIEQIESVMISKVRQRCPVCDAVYIKQRRTMSPLWRCKAGHEFDHPRIETISMTGYEASYGDSFIHTPGAISSVDIKAAAFRPNDQLSMEEISLAKLETALVTKHPGTRGLISAFLDGVALRRDDAEPDLPDDASEPADSFVSTMSDSREKVLRSIKVRRGQKRFRDKLIRRYGAKCVVTGCPLLDLLEAAHIDPYRDENDNHAENGLLLRADIHTLFDLNLLAIHPDTLTLHLHRSVQVAGYTSLARAQLEFPTGRLPAKEPLQRRWASFTRRLHMDS